MQTLAVVCITWGLFYATLHPHQVIAGIVLMLLQLGAIDLNRHVHLPR